MKLDSIEALVKFHEGCRLDAYCCTAGHQTIGYGHNCDVHPIDSTTITQDQADGLFCDDLDRARRIFDALPWAATLDPVRQAILVDMTFQMGLGGVLKFRTTLARVRDKRYISAAQSMLRSKWAKQTPQRAERLATMMETGAWPEV